ncbi:hypothetical protein AQUCO_00300455v1 [Aquilegia coerulea]|uniref:Agenet domain-containing protein n=1 Tax=Aquilegia coerulea TaxID=218851 RepID=A0A2G5EYV4_AQUCA|nr:hypothetical protein AQUCO_00300455v1 [Aquilegia coerulea]
MVTDEAMNAFNVGKIVEVTDEAFKGSWYLAKVIKNFVKKGKKKILLEYEMLKADENGVKPFIDFVDVHLVRPQPPFQQKPSNLFQVNQVVDAFLGQGWWKGKVTRVIEESRYVVAMESLVLEEKMEFGHGELRLHHDWINGQWVIPQPQDRDTHFIQTDVKNADQAQPWQLGNTISIKIDYGLSTVKWNIIDSSPKRGTNFSAPCQKLTNGAAAEDALSRIPQPKLTTKAVKLPPQKDKCQNAETTPEKDGENDVGILCHKCDEATSENGNLPYTKAIGDGKEKTVMQDNNSKVVTLESEELPSTMAIEDRENGVVMQDHSCEDVILTDGKWKSPKTVEDGKKEASMLDNNSNEDGITLESEELPSAMDIEDRENGVVMQDHSCEDVTLADGKWKSPKSVEDGKMEAIMQDNNSDEDGEDKTVMQVHNNKEMTLESEELSFTMDIEDGDNGVVMQNNSCEDVTLTDGKWKSPNVIEDGKKEAVMQDHNSDEDMDTNRQEVVEKTSRAQPSQVARTFRINKSNGSSTSKMKMFRKITKKKIVKLARKRKITHTIESEENEIVQQDHNSDGVIIENRKLPSTEAVGNRDNETVMQDHNSDEVTLQHNNWPFMKSYSLWKDVESREVFQRIPQQPHFHPLKELNEFLREGNALGLTLSFANMFDKLRKAQFDEPRSTFDSKLDTLIRFEALGFNVERVRARIKEFIRLKDNQVKLDGTLQQFEEKVSKEKHEEDSLQAKINEMDEKLRKLNESFDQMNKKRLMVEIKRQSKGSDIVALKREHREIEEKFESAKRDFTHIATAPWSLE